MRHRPHRARPERDDQHSALARGLDERRPGDGLLTQIENDDVGLHRRDVEVHLRKAGEMPGDQARVDVVVGEPLDVVIERMKSGSSKEADLPHRATQHPSGTVGSRDDVARPGEKRAAGSTEAFREGHRDDIEGPG